MNWWNKLLKWNAEADESSVLYNVLHLLFWAIVFGVLLFLLTVVG